MHLLKGTFQLTLHAARVIVDGAIRWAEEQQVAVNVAVVDQGANLMMFARMDGAPLLSATIAQNKAYTAAAFGKGTHEWYPMIAREPALLHGIVHTDRLVIFAGGLPIEVEGRLLGGVGVSGGSAEQDLECARAGVSAFRDALGRDGEVGRGSDPR
jgi:uncharacterized protein GlcG (DUF336 family)